MKCTTLFRCRFCRVDCVRRSHSNVGSVRGSFRDLNSGNEIRSSTTRAAGAAAAAAAEEARVVSKRSSSLATRARAVDATERATAISQHTVTNNNNNNHHVSNPARVVAAVPTSRIIGKGCNRTIVLDGGITNSVGSTTRSAGGVAARICSQNLEGNSGSAGCSPRRGGMLNGNSLNSAAVVAAVAAALGEDIYIY